MTILGQHTETNMDKRELTQDEWYAVCLGVMKDTAKRYLMTGIKIGFLGGLTVGWIAGGLVMLGLS